MKIAVISDIHDNIPRLEEALKICLKEEIKVCICCGDIQQIKTLEILASQFQKVYLSFGNADYGLTQSSGLIPQNVDWNEKVNVAILGGKKIAVVHFDYLAKEIAKSGEFDLVFYGHTHTPWEKKIGPTLMINPGEISGQFGKATFAIFDTKTITARLIILR